MSSVTPSPLPDRDDRLYLRDRVAFCGRVADDSAGHDQQSLLAHRMRYDAVLRNLDLIGEAATRVPVNMLGLALRLPGGRSSAHATDWPTPISVLSPTRSG